jgi:hypothetical protein
MRALIGPVILLPLLSAGQFSGGNFNGGPGRGDGAALFNAPSTMFAGGNGRGDLASTIAPASSTALRFTGASGRGDAAALFTQAPLSAALFFGGSGRGDGTSLLTQPPLALSIYTGGSGRGEGASPIWGQAALRIAIRALLEGPYNSGNGRMSDALRQAGLLPLSEPYTALGFMQVGGGGETIAPAVLSTSNSNSIVDWVLVELRDASTPATVVATRNALLQRDGDVVDTDGTSPLTFPVAPGNYHVALRHRNHLGVMTGSALALGVAPTTLDLTVASTSTFGTDALKSVTGTEPAEVLWMGDVNHDDEIKYVGQDNDRDPVLGAIGGVVPTNTITGYRVEDLNLDGTVKYSGVTNDRDPILQNIGGVVPTNVRSGTLP